jgi:hypothetical protein
MRLLEAAHVAQHTEQEFRLDPRLHDLEARGERYTFGVHALQLGGLGEPRERCLPCAAREIDREQCPGREVEPRLAGDEWGIGDDHLLPTAVGLSTPP